MSAVATAIIGSAVVGAGSSIYGARRANDQADANRQIGIENMYGANQAIYDQNEAARPWYMQGTYNAQDYLTHGFNQQQQMYQPLANEWQSGRGQMYAAQNPNVNPYITQQYNDFNQDPYLDANIATFNRNPNLGADLQDYDNQLNVSNFSDPARFSRQIGDYNANSNIDFDFQNFAPHEFKESPDYQFRMKEGLDAVQNSAAAQGGLYSGNTLRDITDYASNLASSEYGNWFGREMQGAQFDSTQEGRRYDAAAGNFARGMGQQDFNNQQQLTRYGMQSSDYDRAMGQVGFNTGQDVLRYNTGLQQDQLNNQLALQRYGIQGENYERGFGQHGFNNQVGMDMYGVDAANYDRYMGQTMYNNDVDQMRYQQNVDNYGRDYMQQMNERDFNYGRGQDLAQIGIGAIGAQIGNLGDYYGSMGQLDYDTFNRIGQGIEQSGYGYASNYMGGTGYQQQPYYSAAGGINNALQGGLQNWMFYDAYSGGGAQPYGQQQQQYDYRTGAPR